MEKKITETETEPLSPEEIAKQTKAVEDLEKNPQFVGRDKRPNVPNEQPDLTQNPIITR